MSLSTHSVFAQSFLSALSSSLIYLIAAVSGITCFFIGCETAAFFILALLAIKAYLTYDSYKKMQALLDPIKQEFSNLFNNLQSANFNPLPD